ncbi:MAG: sulfite exporter TauE/SafE family protein [Deltaproteobacteria bacterium]|nr:sulfite exporter TauE/SafE family protein [Deltaproteobacteria bacterium]
MSAQVSAAYAQLMSVGVLWITFHCVGMCGPLVVGLDLGGAQAPGARWSALWHVGAYQLGKGAVYAVLGALAGLLGHTVAAWVPVVTPWLGAVMGVVFLVLAWRQRAGRGTVAALVQPGGGRGAAAALSAVMARAMGVLQGRGVVRSLALGAVLAFLPCMVVGWVLLLAASTADVLHGAALMALLAVMTTVPLAGVSALPRLLGPRAVTALQRWLLPVSGAWMLLVSAAALGWIPHASWSWTWWGRGFTLMFF